MMFLDRMASHDLPTPRFLLYLFPQLKIDTDEEQYKLEIQKLVICQFGS